MLSLIMTENSLRFCSAKGFVGLAGAAGAQRQRACHDGGAAGASTAADIGGRLLAATLVLGDQLLKEDRSSLLKFLR